LIDEMALAKNVILLGRSLRGEAKIGLRQPLKSLRVAGLSKQQARNLDIVRGLICDEVNVKTLHLVEKASELVEESVKPNFKILGKKVGGKMKEIQSLLQKWGSAEISTFEANGSVSILGFLLDQNDIEIVRKARPGKFALAGGGIVAELDTELSPELIFEGTKREIINRVQQRRKEMNFHLADRIELRFSADAGSLAEKALLEESFSEGIVRRETLCVRIEAAKLTGEAVDLGQGGQIIFELRKVASK